MALAGQNKAVNLQVQLAPKTNFDRVRSSALDPVLKLQLIAGLCRLNTLAAVKRAGSGHLGSSFSAMDLVVWLYERELNLSGGADRDVYFSSKGHDVPGLYAMLHSLGSIPESRLLKLRRLGGLDGHPNMGVPGIEANTGSLGMGISKGRGMARAQAMLGRAARTFVLTGDGELQEGQIYEALQTTAHQRVSNLHVIVDHNKLQTDKPVDEITALGSLEEKFRSFGWHVARCDGHDFVAIEQVFQRFREVSDRPKILIADTVKGKGVSFMEPGEGLYRWHSGAPDDESFMAAAKELLDSVREQFSRSGLRDLELIDVTPENKPSAKALQEFVAEAYGNELVVLGHERSDLIVLDGDLSADCRVRKFEHEFPERFVENGIAEQDMVSMAGGLALQGMLPVVNSFVSFLSSRANEQIYTNAGEGTKIIYACHFAGLIPAGPGKSHQSIRDISLFGALPNMTILQPCNGEETRQILRYCVNESSESCAIRLAIGPSPRRIELPSAYRFRLGEGAVLREGKDAVLFGYGPVMLHEALVASELLAERGFGLSVINMSSLNRFDIDWLAAAVRPFERIFVLEDHSPVGGLGDRLLATLVEHDLLGMKQFVKFAVEGYPACGTPAEVLRYHRLDGESLAERVGGRAEISQERERKLAAVYTTDAPQ